MAKNNIQNVRFLRNGSLYATREEALTGLNGQTLAAEQDGSIILARYGSGNTVKTLVGLVYVNGENKSLTIFDVDGASANVDEKIKTAIQALDAEKTSEGGKNVQVKVTEVDGKITAVNIINDNTVNSNDVANAIKTEIDKLDYPDTAVLGQYVSQVSQADGKIVVSRVDLPSFEEVKVTGKPIVAVSENKGQVAASAGNIYAQYVDIADSGEKFTATTVEGALAEIATEIDAMDLAVVSGDGEVITAVSEKDGKVSASKTAIKDVKLTGYVKSTTATGAISGNDDIEDALSKLENNIAASQSATTVTNTDRSINVTAAATGTTIGVNINSGEKIISLGNDGIYTDIKLSAVTVSEANVKEAFALIASDGATKLGSTIKIYKDSSLLSVALLHADYSGPQNPVLPTYDKIDGWADITSQTQANQALCFAYENVEGNVVVAAVPVGSFINEQEFASGLTWDSTAGKVIGVVDPSSESFLTVGTNGFKISGVSGLVSNAIEALDVTGDTAHSGQYITHINEENGLISIGGRADISKAPLNDYSKGSDATAVAASDTINQAISKLENQIDTAKSVATTVVAEGTDAGNNMSIIETAGADGHKIFTVNLSDVASAQGLANEIAYRKAVDGVTGDAYTADTNAHYISGASSLYGADQYLDSALNTVDNAMLTGVVAGDGITVSDKASKSQKISAKVNGDGGIVNDETGLHLGTIDCGVY